MVFFPVFSRLPCWTLRTHRVTLQLSRSTVPTGWTVTPPFLFRHILSVCLRGSAKPSPQDQFFCVKACNSPFPFPFHCGPPQGAWLWWSQSPRLRRHFPSVQRRKKAEQVPSMHSGQRSGEGTSEEGGLCSSWLEGRRCTRKKGWNEEEVKGGEESGKARGAWWMRLTSSNTFKQ